MNFPVEVVVGPLAGLVFALWVARELWAAHKESDIDVRKQRDLSTSGWVAQTDATRAQATATNRLADILEAERAERSTRHRSGDA